MPKHFDTMRHFLYELNHSFTIRSITESWFKDNTGTLIILRDIINMFPR